MPTTVPPHHPFAPVSREDIETFAALMPPTGTAIVQLLGVDDALKVINAWRGSKIVIPKGACNNPAGAKRWAYLTEAVGEDIMLKLASLLPNGCLDVPTLERLRTARRNRAICDQFDALTAAPPSGDGLSKARAVERLTLVHHLTWRQIEVILDQPSFEPDPQNQLFGEHY